MTAPERYKTDFNDVDDDGLVTALPGWGGTVVLPQEGASVELFDGDDNTCIGVVTRVDTGNGLIYVEPVWSTWTDGIQSTLPDDLVAALIEPLKRASEGQTTRSAVK